MPSREASKFLLRVYRALRDPRLRVVFKKQRSRMAQVHFWCDGETDRWYEGYMELDPRKVLVPSIVHEFCHLFNPKKKEAEIYKLEGQIMGELSERQMENLINRTMEAIRRGRSESIAEK